MSPSKVIFRVHAIQRMFQRGIREQDVLRVIALGQVVQEYPDDQPYPSRLVLGWSDIRPIHVVLADNLDDDETIIITVYEPDPAEWGPDFMRRMP